MYERAYEKGVVKIGVVAYAPKVVTIWEGIKDYLRGQDFNADWILYSNYPALKRVCKLHTIRNERIG